MIPLLSVVLLGLGTYAIRVSAIALLGRGGSIPPRIERSLHFIAPAVLSALVANTLLLEGGSARPLGPWHVAAIAAALVAIRWTSTTLTLLVGMGVLWVTLAVI